jgi:hypothetical protein
MCHQPQGEVTTPIRPNSFQNASPTNVMPVLYVHSELEPVYAPTNPLNHPENSALRMSHPPVIYPPPDLVSGSVGCHFGYGQNTVGSTTSFPYVYKGGKLTILKNSTNFKQIIIF